MPPVSGKKAKIVVTFYKGKNLVAENVFHSIAGLCGKRIKKFQENDGNNKGPVQLDRSLSEVH